MAATDRIQSMGQEDGSTTAALQFAMSIRERASVSRLSSSGEHADLTFWVFLDTENFGEVESIFRTAYDVQRTHPSAVPFRLHVMPVTQVNQQALPPLTLLFSRS
jgi:hypothetical protein